MATAYEIVNTLTSYDIPSETRKRYLDEFAEMYGWKPSDYMPLNNEISTAHLVVEHGLRNTAVLSFLRSEFQYSDLPLPKINNLLNLSYNNLVDWHIIVGSREVVTIYNRISGVDARVISRTRLGLDEKNYDELHSERFEQITERRPNPNIPSLDTALINNISDWKKKLSAELNLPDNQAVSSLFSAIIFTRAVEDSFRYRQHGDYQSQILLGLVNEAGVENSFGLSQIIYNALNRLLGDDKIPDYLYDVTLLKVFDDLDYFSVKGLIASFYQGFSPYTYDFSMMSKQALSRIYERYVAILEDKTPVQSKQLSLFPNNYLPVEKKDKAYGSVYTPEYIARFFVRFFQKSTSPTKFLFGMAADPAVGSGIFLRTLLEQRYEFLMLEDLSLVNPERINRIFDSIWGIDIDKNATQATRLSIALLQLAIRDSLPEQLSDLEKFPKQINIDVGETIEYYQQHASSLEEAFEVIISNPPFVRLEHQLPAIRERILEILENISAGRSDTYLAFLYLSLKMLKPGGFGFFVLPHSFLIQESAKELRRILSEQTWILCLADLSEINIFENYSAYCILLVFQKKPNVTYGDPPPAVAVKCSEFVGRALQSALEGREEENSSYSIYLVNQEFFRSKRWTIVSKPTIALQQKLQFQFPKLSDFLDIRQGFVTGADPIFIRFGDDIPESEKAIYAPYLPDREMTPYNVPDKTDKMVFYPYLDNRYITEQELRSMFPETWEYLSAHKKQLSERKSVPKEWWKPTSSRPPERLRVLSFSSGVKLGSQ